MSGTCSSPIECGQTISPEAAFKKLIQVDVNGCAALNTVEVSADDPAASFLNCDMSQVQDWRMLFFQMITEDENGNWALSVIKSNPAP